jgi:hypothetical protein
MHHIIYLRLLPYRLHNCRFAVIEGTSTEACEPLEVHINIITNFFQV